MIFFFHNRRGQEGIITAILSQYYGQEGEKVLFEQTCLYFSWFYLLDDRQNPLVDFCNIIKLLHMVAGLL